MNFLSETSKLQIMSIALNHFSIELDEDTHTFVPGSTITGMVKLSTTSPLKASKITLHAIGQARITFSSMPNEIYFKHESMLFLGNNDAAELAPGHHEFPFIFILPSSCPRSVNCGFGSIKYSITAIIHGFRWFNQNRHESITFKVTPKMDVIQTLTRPKTIIDKRSSWYSRKRCLRVMVCQFDYRLKSSNF